MAKSQTDTNYKSVFETGSTIIPTYWSSVLLEDLKKELVFGSLTNAQYIGEVRYGQTLKVFSVSDVRITDYSPLDGFPTNWTPDRAYAKEEMTLTIDQVKAFQFFVEDLEDRAVLVDLMSNIMRETTYSLRDIVDQYIAGKFESGATPAFTNTSGTEIVKALQNVEDFYELLVDVDTLMNKNNVPRNGRWIVVPPELRALLLKDNRFVANASSPQAYVSLLNGEVGQAAGFTVKMSNNVPSSTPNEVNETQAASEPIQEQESSVPSGSLRFYAGTNDALAFAYDVEKIETYRPENRFADAVKGLFVYGGKVIRPVCVYKVAVKLPVLGQNVPETEPTGS